MHESLDNRRLPGVIEAEEEDTHLLFFELELAKEPEETHEN